MNGGVPRPDPEGPGRPRRLPPVALTIAGSDSGGGAGVQADLKTFLRFGVHGTSAITLITAQNSLGVRRVETLEPALVAEQIRAVAQDFEVRAAKTGALGSSGIVEAVAAELGRCALPALVVDPVARPTRGDPFLSPEALERLGRLLLPRATLVTPNLDEAAALAGRAVENEEQMRDAARALRDRGAAAVLVKGGHLPGPEAVDLLLDGDELLRLAVPRIEGAHAHGTGCTLSAAITAFLARGDDLVTAVRAAKEFVTRAIAGCLGLGRGQGPVNHWA